MIASLLSFLCYALLCYALTALIIAALRHPGDAAGLRAALLRAVSRWVPLRFSDSPGTLHCPGFGQPLPDAEEPTASALEAAARAGRDAFAREDTVRVAGTATDDLPAWQRVVGTVLAELQHQARRRALGFPPRPAADAATETARATGRIITGLLLLAVLGLAWACTGASRRATTALEVWGQAQDAQVAATTELAELTMVTEADLVQPRPGRLRGNARADLERWWRAQEGVLETARLTRKATQGASVELALDSEPAAKEAAARTAWEAARRLQRELEALRILSAALRRGAAAGGARDGGGADAGVL